MANENTAKRATTMVSKIAPAGFQPKAYAGELQKDGVTRWPLGTLIGIVTDVFERTMPTGEAYEGLKGTFEYVPNDVTKPILRSGACYLPSGFQELLSEPIKETDDAGNRRNANIQFGFAVGLVKAANAAGYSWELTPLTEPGEADPLKLLRDQVTGVKQLEAPKPAAKGKGE